jgi:6-phosphofructokinase
MKIGIVNSGGDVQGLNAVIASAVNYGTSKGHTFVGFNKGWEGILDLKHFDLTKDKVRGISHLGGTILHSVNKGRFAGKAGSKGGVNAIPDEILDLAKTNLEKLDVGALIVIGGDGTLSAANQLYKKGVKIIGVPKTIDNDLKGTDQTFGFSTAVDVVVEALDRIHTTAVSHDRVFFIETMGRHAGWIALHAGLAGGADAILLPEIKFSYAKLIEFLRKRKNSGRNYSIVVVAEGATAVNEDLALLENTGDRPEIRLGGISDQIMHKIDEISPSEFEMRNVVLGHIQRGGTPNAEDRILSKTYGVAAIDAISAKKYGHMVTYVARQTNFVSIAEAVGDLKLVEDLTPELQTAKKIGVFLGE